LQTAQFGLDSIPAHSGGDLIDDAAIKAMHQGYVAGVRLKHAVNLPPPPNPYPEGSNEHEAWNEGFDDASDK
jgi:hypothetical protein